jgi:6-phosphogluconate dehydrogenase
MAMMKSCELGLIGLGVMGRNFVLNLADRGFAVAGYDRQPEKVAALAREAGGRPVRGAATPQAFVGLLRSPRAVMLLVPAGAVDAVIQDLVPLLSPGDLVVDGGNSHFRDTDRRAKQLEASGFHYLGVGVSGGEEGARRGPSMMPGGAREAYERVRPLFEAAAARADGDPCVTWLGPGSAGHYVKMVHNGIEYGLMELIAETYDLLRRGLGLQPDELAEVYGGWNRGPGGGFLLEITAAVFREPDPESGERLVDRILDRARQKGTGRWTSQDAMDLLVPASVIDAAVAARELSALKEERVRAAELLTGPEARYAGDRAALVQALENAFYAGMVLTFAQGMVELGTASRQHGYGLDLEAVARIWRGGCIIRARLLEKIRAAYRARPELPNLLLDPDLGSAVLERQAELRAAVAAAVELGIPAPGLMAALAYFDGYRSARLPANLIQAQRDYFGAHTYERVDREGTFHTRWGNAVKDSGQPAGAAPAGAGEGRT